MHGDGPPGTAVGLTAALMVVVSVPTGLVAATVNVYGVPLASPVSTVVSPGVGACPEHFTRRCGPARHAIGGTSAGYGHVLRLSAASLSGSIMACMRSARRFCHPGAGLIQ